MSKPTRPSIHDAILGAGRKAARLQERVIELEAENAELRKETESCADVNADLLDDLTRAVELLGKVRDAHHLPGSHCEMEDAVVEVDAFLFKMEDTDDPTPWEAPVGPGPASDPMPHDPGRPWRDR